MTSMIPSSQALAGTGGSPSTSNVSIVATFTFQGQQVTVGGPVGQGALIFDLLAPVELGTLDDFINWVTKQFGITGFSAATIHDAINEIPIESLANALNGLFTDLHLWLNVLHINTNTKSYALGCSIVADPPVNVFGVIQFDSIGIMVGQQDATGSP